MEEGVGGALDGVGSDWTAGGRVLVRAGRDWLLQLQVDRGEGGAAGLAGTAGQVRDPLLAAAGAEHVPTHPAGGGRETASAQAPERGKPGSLQLSFLFGALHSTNHHWVTYII